MDYRDMVEAAGLVTSEASVRPKALEFALPGNELLERNLRQFLDARARYYPIPICCFYEKLPSDVGKLFKLPAEHVSSLFVFTPSDQ